MSSILRPGDDPEEIRQLLTEDLARWKRSQTALRVQYKVREQIWTAEQLAPVLLEMEQVTKALEFIEGELAALPADAVTLSRA